MAEGGGATVIEGVGIGAGATVGIGVVAIGVGIVGGVILGNAIGSGLYPPQDGLPPPPGYIGSKPHRKNARPSTSDKHTKRGSDDPEKKDCRRQFAPPKKAGGGKSPPPSRTSG